MLSYYQAYWWLIISVLGAILVFLLFVQGGQTMLCHGRGEHKTLMVNSLGRKWEFTYTTLVVFGGAFFASFPLFYSTSFGGAYWLWMLILVSFVVQAVSYEFRRKKGNLYGTLTYDTLLAFNGLFGCVMLGVAVGTMFFGGEFEVSRANLADNFSNPVISQWSSTHGLEAMTDWRCLLLGLVVFFLARTQASMYFINNIQADDDFATRMRGHTLINGGIFAVLFITFAIVLLTTTGLRFAQGKFIAVENIYLGNLLQMWWAGILLLIGVILVLYAIIRTAISKTYRAGIWYSGAGTVMVVVVLFFIAGYCDTAYLPSVTNPQSSLTIANSSSSLFTLRTMSVVSILIPFVLAYIWYVWRKMNSSPLTEQELDTDSHVY